MLQTRIRNDQDSVTSGLQQNAFSRSSLFNALRKPAIWLVFLTVITGALFVSLSRSHELIKSEQPNVSSQSNLESEIKTADEGETVAEPLNAAADNSSEQNVNSIKIESTTVNGVTDTKLEVNGQEIPVDPNTTTHITQNNNGSESVTSVITQNSQVGSNGFNYNSNNSSSFSHSFNSQSNVGGN